ncbi:hypothetical protein H7097_04610 [Aeromicrobium sp.]|nr:hypothetical protein [Candidatus Saccharibacteria bacterium]
MSDAKSQRDGNIPADLQPYYDQPKGSTRAWARWLTRVLAAVIVVILLVIFVRWVWHQTHTDDKSKATTGSSNIEKDTKPKTANGSKTDNTATSTAPNTPAPTSTTPTTGGNSATATQTVGQTAGTTLANTGPGQTVAIFITASAVFAVLYEIRLRKQVS